MGRRDWVPSKDSALCSEHFNSDCFGVRDTKKFLKPGSVPTIFKNFMVIPNFTDEADIEKKPYVTLDVEIEEAVGFVASSKSKYMGSIKIVHKI